jgi:hypothetical protein
MRSNCRRCNAIICISCAGTRKNSFSSSRAAAPWRYPRRRSCATPCCRSGIPAAREAAPSPTCSSARFRPRAGCPSRCRGAPPTCRPWPTTTCADAPTASPTIEPLYPFGFGLSYARLAYGPLALGAGTLASDQELTVRTTITNSSARTAHETAQCYLVPPRSWPEAPRATLIGFQKVPVPAHGRIEVEFKLAADLFSGRRSRRARLGAGPLWYRGWRGLTRSARAGAGRPGPGLGRNQSSIAGL